MHCQLDGLSEPEVQVIGLSCKCRFSNIPPTQGANIEIIPFNGGGEGPSTGWFTPTPH